MQCLHVASALLVLHQHLLMLHQHLLMLFFVHSQGLLKKGSAVQEAQQQSDETSLKAKVQSSSSDVSVNIASNGDDDAMWC